MRGKTIRQFLLDGIPDGRWISELSNWTGKAYKIPRTYVNLCMDRKELNYTGVYFLFGQSDDDEMPQVLKPQSQRTQRNSLKLTI